MRLVLGLAAAASVTWFSRSVFITFLPADRLPRRLHDALADSGPPILGAIVALMLLAVPTAAGTVLPAFLALAVASVLALRGVPLVVVVVTAVVIGSAGNLVVP